MLYELLKFLPSEKNALYTYYTRHVKWLHAENKLLTIFAGIAIGLGLFLLGLFIVMVDDFTGYLMLAVVVVSKGAMFVLPLLVAISAAQFAKNELQRDAQEILNTTLLTRVDIFDANFYSVLARFAAPAAFILAGYISLYIAFYSALVYIIVIGRGSELIGEGVFYLTVLLALFLVVDATSFYCRLKLAAGLGTRYGMNEGNTVSSAVGWAILGQLIIEVVISIGLSAATFLMVAAPFVFVKMAQDMPERWRQKVAELDT